MNLTLAKFRNREGEEHYGERERGNDEVKIYISTLI